jgi:hypothetical protein
LHNPDGLAFLRAAERLHHLFRCPDRQRTISFYDLFHASKLFGEV